MLRIAIHANETTDVTAERGRLVASCERAGLSVESTATIVDDVVGVLSDLVEKGRAIAALNSQMTVDRTVANEVLEVSISFAVGRRRGLLARLSSLLGR